MQKQNTNLTFQSVVYLSVHHDQAVLQLHAVLVVQWGRDHL